MSISASEVMWTPESGSAVAGNLRFRNALARRPQVTPPIWLMRQAGRYHGHYQQLRRQHSFMDLCKQPELAAQVALGPVLDFDFDAAILFSDLLFPLEALGFGLEYTDSGPQLAFKLNQNTQSRLREVEEAFPHLLFQGEALRLTRSLLPADKSLIGFVGGPWTLFVYAVAGTHKNASEARGALDLFGTFCEKLVPLLIRNIELQFANGAEVVMVFDTAAGDLGPDVFQSEVVPQLERLTERFPSRLGYYSKGTSRPHLEGPFFTDGSWAGIGIDADWDLREALDLFSGGFVQGNFSQQLLLTSPDELRRGLESFLNPLLKHHRTGWVCGLGHGVLPGTPPENVRLFVNTVREVLQ
ncbi:MAG TPA: uroporphyrinogen decarboxylase family protein [Pyrinomonadaceae bacterium]|nr:uroporphyrinogen decarboxylase family protein [Pyrinomonadaceae bacterium]